MKKLLLFAILSLLLVPISASGQTPLDTLQQKLIQNMEAAIADGLFMGGVAAVLIPGQDPIYYASGWADQQARARFQTTTLTRTASIAKPMTAVAALQLHERGLLDLDAPIEHYLPEFPQGDKITARQLLYHTAGISSYRGKEPENTTFYPTLAAAVAVFQDRPLQHEAGSTFAYSTYGYTLLGRIIEVAAGQSYEDYMQTYVWNPAGMSNTGVERLDINYENKSALYSRTKKGKLKRRPVNDLSNRIPGGGFYATAEDLLRFGQAVVQSKLLADTTTALMFTLPEVPKEGNPYAMGWNFYGPAGQEGAVVGHAGEQTGCAAQLMLHRETGIVMVILTNTGRAWQDVIGLTVELFPLAYRAVKEGSN